VQIESIRVARGNQIEVTATYKNNSRRRLALSPGDVDMIITDADGVGVREIGNLYGVPQAPTWSRKFSANTSRWNRVRSRKR
jgi:hypothetical protein